jgi:hypothetical protein
VPFLEVVFQICNRSEHMSRSRGHANSQAATDWARKRKDAMERAKALRAERTRGDTVTEEHTFKPQQISKPPSRESAVRGHPGVFDRNGKDVYYDRQQGSYPVPPYSDMDMGMPPKKPLSELDQLHMAGDHKFGKPRGYVPPVDQYEYEQQRSSSGYDYQQQQAGSVEDELDRFYAGQFETQQQQSVHQPRTRPQIQVQDDHHGHAQSRYGHVMSPNSDSLVHEARRVYNDPSIGRGGENDFLTAQQVQAQRFKTEQQAYIQNQRYAGNVVDARQFNRRRGGGQFEETAQTPPHVSANLRLLKKKVRRKTSSSGSDDMYGESNDQRDLFRHDLVDAQASNGSGKAVQNSPKGNKHQEEADQMFQSFLRGEVDHKKASGWNSDFTDDRGWNSHGGLEEQSAPPPKRTAASTNRRKPVQKKRAEWNNGGDHADRQDQHHPNPSASARPYRQMISADDIAGGGAPKQQVLQTRTMPRQGNGEPSYQDHRGSGHGRNGSRYRPTAFEEEGASRRRQEPARAQQPKQQPSPFQPYENDGGYGANRSVQDQRDSYSNYQTEAPARQEPPRNRPMEVGMADEHAPPMQLHPCPHCSRKFNEKAYAKHVPNCDKTKKKRKPMDMTAARLADAAKMSGDVRGAIRNAKMAVKESKKDIGSKPWQRQKKNGSRRPTGSGAGGGKWKQQSNALREAMKQSRIVTKYQKEGRLDELPPMQSSQPDPSFTPCPHCGRTFNEKAAERHIPRCADIKAKPKFQKRGVGKSASSTARRPQGRGRF